MDDAEALPLLRDSYGRWKQVSSHEPLARLLAPGMLSDCLAEAKKQLLYKCTELLELSENMLGNRLFAEMESPLLLLEKLQLVDSDVTKSLASRFF